MRRRSPLRGSAAFIFATAVFARWMLAVPICCGSWPYAALYPVILLGLIFAAWLFRVGQAFFAATLGTPPPVAADANAASCLMFGFLEPRSRTRDRANGSAPGFACVALLGVVIAATGAEAIHAFASHAASPVPHSIGLVASVAWVVACAGLVWRSLRASGPR